MKPREILESLFHAAVEAARANPTWFGDLKPPRGRTVVVGAGKASAAMAREFETNRRGRIEGLVVTRYGHGAETKHIEVIEASHPVPDDMSLTAARRTMEMVHGLGPDDLVVSLMSGGGSSLLTLPADGITLAEKQAVTKDLLLSGATIREINTVRKHLSAIKGGRLLKACKPARVVTYVVSDVPGDDPSLVASGPTVPDSTTPEEARLVLERYNISTPLSIRRHLSNNLPPWEVMEEVDVRVVASSQISLERAGQRARALGIHAHILSDSVEGEAREVAKVHAAIARQIQRRSQPFPPPCVLLSGGETTVTVRGKGRGGRNVEFLAALAQSLEGAPGIYALATDTDGIDGDAEAAGAYIEPSTFARAGQELSRSLHDNDAHSLFQALGDQLITGPTLTNVNDFRAILITPHE